MNIKPNQHRPSRALDSLPRPENSQVPPSEDGKFTIDDIICPFQRVAYNEGVLKVDETGKATNLPEVLKKFAGAGWAITGLANHAAKELTTGGNWSAIWADSYNVQDLEGSSLDHTADSQILRGGFNQERLDKALSFSSDGERLTLGDLRRFQKANLEEEPGKRGEIFGAAEFALLVKVFGRTDAEGTKFIKNSDMVRIYKDNKWPEGWEPPKPGSLNFVSTGLAVNEYFSSDGQAEAVVAAGQAEKKSGVCPFITGQPYDMAEAAKQHSDKLQ
jgi:hypothetical protein